MQRIIVKNLIEIRNDNTTPPPDIIGDGIMIERSLLTIIGPAKSGKSFLAMNFASAIASGGSFSGFTIDKPRKVLYLSAEGGYYPNRDRLKLIGDKIPNQFAENLLFANISYMPINEPKELDILEGLIKQYMPNVLVLDPFIKFHNVEENSSSALVEIFGAIRRLMEGYNLSVILPHHTGKSSSKGPRGSSAIQGEYDTSISIERNKSLYTFKFDTRHTLKPKNILALFNKSSFWFERIADEGLIIDYLEKNGPMRRRKLVKDGIELDYFSESHGYRLIDSAITNNKIVEKDKMLMVSE